MVINNDFEISYLPIEFARLGTILVGDLLSMLRLQNWHRTPLAPLRALLGFVLIKVVPMFT